MQALAAASRTPLVEGDEILALVHSNTGLDPLLRVTEVADTCVVYKAGRHIAALRDHLAEVGDRAVAGINVGLPNEQLASRWPTSTKPLFHQRAVYTCAAQRNRRTTVTTAAENNGVNQESSTNADLPQSSEGWWFSSAPGPGPPI